MSSLRLNSLTRLDGASQVKSVAALSVHSLASVSISGKARAWNVIAACDEVSSGAVRREGILGIDRDDAPAVVITRV